MGCQQSQSLHPTNSHYCQHCKNCQQTPQHQSSKPPQILQPIPNFDQPGKKDLIITHFSPQTRIQHIGFQDLTILYFRNGKIPQQPYSFKVKIIQVCPQDPFSIWMTIGIADYECYKMRRIDYQDRQTASFYTKSEAQFATIYPEKKLVRGFKKGDTVETCVCLKEKTVKWLVNGIEAAKTSSQFLGDKDKVFMPFLAIKYVGSVVQWYD